MAEGLVAFGAILTRVAKKCNPKIKSCHDFMKRDCVALKGKCVNRIIACPGINDYARTQWTRKEKIGKGVAHELVYRQISDNR